MPKRARYTATLSRGDSLRTEDQVVLAYGHQSAVDFFSARGYKVRKVRKGDFVNCADQGGWHVDSAALRQAIKDLDLKWPVRIKQSSKQGDRRGVHQLKYENQRVLHEIRIKSYLSAEQASSTLRHELMHAHQAERACRRDHPTEADGIGLYSIAAAIDAWSHDPGRRKGQYRNEPIEVEARAYQNRADHAPLTKRGRQ